MSEMIANNLKWVPYAKGGSFRKWYGNYDYVVNWKNEGEEIKDNTRLAYPDVENVIEWKITNESSYLLNGITWSRISFSFFGVRILPDGFIFSDAGCAAFPKGNIQIVLGFLCSKLVSNFLAIINPTLTFQVGDIKIIPYNELNESHQSGLLIPIVDKTISYAKSDWDSYETSWNFEMSPLLQKMSKTADIVRSYEGYRDRCRQMTDQTKQLEEENNRIFIEAYGLQDELTPDVPIEEITLFANPQYRYKGDLTDDEREARFKEDTMKELINYAVGCMMGRYSLDMPGLVYAHAGNKEFDAKKYETFPADEDGVIPITEREWFDDDAACRFFRFIETAWDKKGLDTNLDFIADAIGRKSGESSREVIRRYSSDGFFKDHCQTYKNRPIYWLFSSGKEKAFQAIVYLHRYNEGTLSRMRTEYVLPLQTRISRQIEHLEKDRDAVSGSAANKIQREIIALRKHQAELQNFDELLRHYADKKIRLDLDDGVKVNYAKFGDLLADVKKISGVKEGEDAATD